jgi:fatty acid amide hydrolase 2
MPLTTESATRLAERIRRRETSSEEIVSAHVAHARRTHDAIHAIVRDRFEEALSEARAADARIAREGTSDLPPFFGVPCTIKESFAFAGMPQSAGLVSRRDFRAKEDAITVARIRASGAIPLGVTNTSELCMWMESSNRVYGTTNNAYDRKRTAGGSSGGEGAIVGVGASPFGLGSDIGGSIRMPAFFNGVFGHKPTPGCVPNEGQFPVAHGQALRYLCTGPIARRAEDLWPLLRVLAGGTAPPGDPRDVSMKGLVVLDVAENGRLRVEGELRAAQIAAARALERHGAIVRDWTSPLLRHSLEMWAVLMSDAGGPTFAELMGQGHAVPAFRELARWMLGRSEHTFAAIGLAVLEKVPALKGEKARRFAAMASELRAQITSALGDHGVLLFPPYPRTAPRHHAAMLPPIQWMYTAVFNALELPATVAPLGLGARGLPLGVQIVSAPGRDAVTIAVAKVLEEELGGWVPPPA